MMLQFLEKRGPLGHFLNTSLPLFVVITLNTYFIGQLNSSLIKLAVRTTLLLTKLQNAI